MNYRKPKHHKLSLDKALDKYYAEAIEKGEIEATGPNCMEITAKPFASYLLFLGLVNHWGKILREVTGRTVYITASYYGDNQELRHETKEYLTMKDFLNKL